MTTVRLFLPAFLALLLVAASPPAAAVAQTPVTSALHPPASGKVQRITLRDGSELIGKITAVDSVRVTFESALGITSIAIESILSVVEEEPGEVRNGRYFFPNPNATRLIFAPTGRMLRGGEGYFSDYWIFFPGIVVGVSDNVTMGGGISIFPGQNPSDQVWYVTPKFGVIQGPKFNAAIGALAASVPSDNDHNTAGILYGVATWGGPDQSFTSGLGYGFVNGNVADSPVLMVGGETRPSPRISLVTENYMFPGGRNFTFSGGVRFMGRKVSVDLALAKFVTETDGFCCIPFLGFVWKW